MFNDQLIAHLQLSESVKEFLKSVGIWTKVWRLFFDSRCIEATKNVRNGKNNSNINRY